MRSGRDLRGGEAPVTAVSRHQDTRTEEGRDLRFGLDLIVRQRTQSVNMHRGVTVVVRIGVRHGTGHAITCARRRLQTTDAGRPKVIRDVGTSQSHQRSALHRRVFGMLAR